MARKTVSQLIVPTHWKKPSKNGTRTSNGIRQLGHTPTITTPFAMDRFVGHGNNAVPAINAGDTNVPASDDAGNMAGADGSVNAKDDSVVEAGVEEATSGGIVLVEETASARSWTASGSMCVGVVLRCACVCRACFLRS